MWINYEDSPETMSERAGDQTPRDIVCLNSPRNNFTQKRDLFRNIT